MSEDDKAKRNIRLGDDGELYDDEDTQPHHVDKLKRKAKPADREITPLLLSTFGFLLMLVCCVVTLQLVAGQVRQLWTGVRVVPGTRAATALPSATSPAPTLWPTPAPPTLTPTLVITPPTIGIGERPMCTGIGGNERIVFDTVYGDDNREVYLLDLSQPAVSNICRLTNDAATDGDPVWHPNGNAVLFNHDGDLWRVNVDGSGGAAIVTGTDGQWDNSGDWVVFSGADGGIAVAAADGIQGRLVSGVALWDEFEPDCCSLNFSALLPVVVYAAAPRDGTAGTSDGNARELFTINADGTGRVQLTDNGDYDDEPDWSPGGNQIVFTRGRYGFNTDIWIMNADGSNPRQLTTDEATDHSPRWLPDGRIMFVSERERAGAIYVMNADGSDVHPITAPLGVLTFDYWKAG